MPDAIRAKTGESQVDAARKHHPSRHTAQTKATYLNGDHGAVGSFGGFAPRAKLGQPPDTARIGYDRAARGFFAGVLDRSGDGSHIGADRHAATCARNWASTRSGQRA
jgi:hypothetical protein